MCQKIKEVRMREYVRNTSSHDPFLGRRYASGFLHHHHQGLCP
jgi:hypothetical protein